ncbi:toxin-antitoxin system YwqK family antitoxin [Flammeovirga agarivorans]|uniref:Antitoxin component YwqK of the YwqJK toxin-antitoxin module n=1 Tax=Flammeovirga agarivorans TaxID=2726742 RepID=A0A7X8XYX2_9BACT|nr:hypothetical protein [Flammeovirga agarivorans]NLR94430.1 hypothetical protein [Flammeovirga agarivorans]
MLQTVSKKVFFFSLLLFLANYQTFAQSIYHKTYDFGYNVESEGNLVLHEEVDTASLSITLFTFRHAYDSSQYTLIGSWKFYDAYSGDKELEVTFLNDSSQYEQQFYDGILAEEGLLVNNKKVGIWRKYEKAYTTYADYKDGNEEVIEKKSYSKNTSILVQHYFYNQKISRNVGDETSFYDDGSLKYKAHYNQEGKILGKALSYYEDGKLKTEKYTEGTIRYEKTYDRKGQLTYLEEFNWENHWEKSTGFYQGSNKIKVITERSPDYRNKVIYLYNKQSELLKKEVVSDSLISVTWRDVEYNYTDHSKYYQIFTSANGNRLFVINPHLIPACRQCDLKVYLIVDKNNKVIDQHYQVNDQILLNGDDFLTADLDKHILEIETNDKGEVESVMYSNRTMLRYYFHIQFSDNKISRVYKTDWDHVLQFELTVNSRNNKIRRDYYNEDYKSIYWNYTAKNPIKYFYVDFKCLVLMDEYVPSNQFEDLKKRIFYDEKVIDFVKKNLYCYRFQNMSDQEKETYSSMHVVVFDDDPKKMNYEIITSPTNQLLPILILDEKEQPIFGIKNLNFSVDQFLYFLNSIIGD